jgi:hypothetical protein
MPREGDDPAAALALAEAQLTEAKQAGSILFICDGLTVAEAARLAKQRKRGAAPVLILAPVDAHPENREHRELEEAARTLDAPLEFMSPDQRDVTAVAAKIERELTDAAAAGGERWRDEGHWLLPLLGGLALLWFRPGWVVDWE